MGWFTRKAAPARDADLDRLHAALEASRRQPEGNDGSTMTAADVVATAEWMAARFGAGDYQPVWDRRLAIGYDLGPEGVPAATWFWFNAHPALAALRLGEKAHPFVATCAGYADQARWDVDEPEARAAVTEIHERYFGS
jgi:hypothetical protein